MKVREQHGTASAAQKEAAGVKVTSVEKVAKLVLAKKTVSEVIGKTGVTILTIDRYLRLARKRGLLPGLVRMQGNQFILEGDLDLVPQGSGIDVSLIFGDLHCPFHDNRAVSVVCQIIEDLKPDHVIENGDGVDCYEFSKFSRDPLRAQSFQKERDSHKKIMERIRDASGADYLYVGGDEDNHFIRWVHNVVWANNLGDVPELQPARILYLKDEEYVEGPIFINKTFRISHGTRYGENAAKLSMMDFMISGLQNHSHRLQAYYRTSMETEYVYVQNGHLTDVKKSYKKHPNWQSGFSILYMLPDGRFRLEQVPIVKAKTIFRGKLYRG